MQIQTLSIPHLLLAGYRAVAILALKISNRLKGKFKVR
jgi:hypothetical protein